MDYIVQMNIKNIRNETITSVDNHHSNISLDSFF